LDLIAATLQRAEHTAAGKEPLTKIEGSRPRFGPHEPRPVIDLAAHLGIPTSCSGYRIKGYFSMRSTAPSTAAAIPIGELSRRTGVTIETIRYYERINMLAHPPRTASGRRVYGDVETRTLAFIRRARELGFTLDEIRALLALSTQHRHDACAEVRHLAADHLEDVRAKIADLRAMARVLADAVRRCDTGASAGCPLIDALSAVSSAESR
jgi:MerR family mercuric resistance operon transcriptional regulator